MAKAREIIGLDCRAPAVPGMRLVLLTRLDEMCGLRAASLDWSDAAGVHDMRVASRRLRSALRDFSPYLRGKVRQKGLRKLAHTLGAVRDEDVAIKALEKLKAEVPEEVAIGLSHIIDERRWRRERAREVLEEAISEGRLERLQEKLMDRVERSTRIAPEEHPDGESACAEAQSFRRAGVEIIRSRLEELYELGESLYQPFAIERLHSMRIAAKRLRYAIELFSQCWGEELVPFSSEIARMQDSLGDLHDCDEWIEDLGRRLRRTAEAPEEAAPTRMALRHAFIWLLQHYTKERDKHYRQALERWREWDEQGFSANLLQIFSDSVPEGDDISVAHGF